jgi:hypothetical protein
MLAMYTGSGFGMVNDVEDATMLVEKSRRETGNVVRRLEIRGESRGLRSSEECAMYLVVYSEKVLKSNRLGSKFYLAYEPLQLPQLLPHHPFLP